MSERPRVIVNALPSDYTLVGRVVDRVTNPEYQWPDDNIACVSFTAVGQETWQGRNFHAIRRKTCITIYGPEQPA